MAAFLDRALNFPPAPDRKFTDTGNAFYAFYAERLRHAGITRGCNAAGTRYCGQDTVTRAQVASLLVRALGL
ncbi:MAG: hypothetical protein ACNA8W_07670 [Bradymonadaceae bacterium]